MLIDWELAAPDRGFEIQVRDVRQAVSFYREVLGAREMFRRETSDGAPLRTGLAAEGVRFVVTSQDEDNPEPILLSRLAAELGVPFLAVVLHVDDPDRVTRAALQSGAVLMESPDCAQAVVVTDPFGSQWAFVKREPADSSLSSIGDRRRSHGLHSKTNSQGDP